MPNLKYTVEIRPDELDHSGSTSKVVILAGDGQIVGTPARGLFGCADKGQAQVYLDIVMFAFRYGFSEAASELVRSVRVANQGMDCRTKV